jgi:hypothetical protein
MGGLPPAGLVLSCAPKGAASNQTSDLLTANCQLFQVPLPLGSRQARSNGRRQARGAINE